MPSCIHQSSRTFHTCISFLPTKPFLLLIRLLNPTRQFKSKTENDANSQRTAQFIEILDHLDSLLKSLIQWSIYIFFMVLKFRVKCKYNHDGSGGYKMHGFIDKKLLLCQNLITKRPGVLTVECVSVWIKYKLHFGNMNLVHLIMQSLHLNFVISFIFLFGIVVINISMDYSMYYINYLTVVFILY